MEDFGNVAETRSAIMKYVPMSLKMSNLSREVQIWSYIHNFSNFVGLKTLLPTVDHRHFNLLVLVPMLPGN